MAENLCARNTVDASTPGARGIKNGSKAKLMFFSKQKWFWSTEMKKDLPIIWRSVKKCLVFLHFYQIFCIYMPKAEPPQNSKFFTSNDLQWCQVWPSLMKVLQDPMVDDPHEPGLQALMLLLLSLLLGIHKIQWKGFTLFGIGLVAFHVEISLRNKKSIVSVSHKSLNRGDGESKASANQEPWPLVSIGYCHFSAEAPWCHFGLSSCRLSQYFEGWTLVLRYFWWFH